LEEAMAFEEGETQIKSELDREEFAYHFLRRQMLYPTELRAHPAILL
jgi:hypothetical protein